MKMATKDKIQMKEPLTAAIQSNVPAYLRRAPGQRPAGFENMDRSDWTLPRLGLCQSNSPQRSEGDAKFIEGLKDGQFFNSITQAIYGKAVKIVPLMFFKSRIRFRDMDEGGGILCRADDGKKGIGDPGGTCEKCPMALFTQGDNKNTVPPECDHFYNYAVLVLPTNGNTLGPESLAVMSLKSTGLKTAREFNALLRLRNTDFFAGVYDITSAVQKNQAKQSWFTHVIKSSGWVSETQLEIAKAVYESVSAAHTEGRLKVDAEDLETEGREPGSDDL
jgi:hypothetical protein